MSLRDWVAEERARERARSQELRFRETFPQTGPGGQAFPASPVVRSRRVNVPPVNVVRNPPYGRSVTVTTTQKFDGGGTACQWSAVKDGHTSAGLLGWIAGLPQTSFEVPQLAYYGLDIEVVWDGYDLGGFVRVLKNGTELWFDQAPYGTSFSRTFHLGVLDPENDEIIVEVSPVGDDTVQPDGKTATVTGSFYLIELPVQVVREPAGAILTTFSQQSGLRDGVSTIGLPLLASEGDAVLLVIANQQGNMSGGSGTYHRVETLAPAADVDMGDSLWSQGWAQGISGSNTRGRHSLWWLPLTSTIVAAGQIEFETKVLDLATGVEGKGAVLGVLVAGGGTITPSFVTAGASWQTPLTLADGKVLVAAGVSSQTTPPPSPPWTVTPSTARLAWFHDVRDGVSTWPVDDGTYEVNDDRAAWTSSHIVGWT